MNDSFFLTLEDIVFIYTQEIQVAGGEPNIRDEDGIEAFVDGNKRTALASALTFLDLNGYGVKESYEEELADLVLDFVTKEISKEEVAQHLESHFSLRD